MQHVNPGREHAAAASAKRFALVLNAAAGSVLGADPEARLQRLARVLEDRMGSAPVEAAVVKGAEIGAAIERAAAGPAEVVVIAGGDGTVSAAAPIVRNHGKILGVIPLGTYNLLARDLEIPLETDEAIANLATGIVRDIDVATVNGRMFLCQSGFGFFTRVVYARQKQRKSHLGKWVQSALAFVDALRHLRKVDVIVRADGQKLRFPTLAMLIAINSYHRNPAKLLQRDRLDGGHFALYSVRYRSVAGLVLFALKLVLRIWHRDERLEIVSSRQLVVSSRRRRHRYRSRRLPLTADGELLIMQTPVQYRLYPKALKVLAPPPKTPSEEHDAPDRAPL